MILHNYCTTEDFLYKHMTFPDFSGQVSMHTHDICELLFIRKGAMTYIEGGKRYRLLPDSLVISRPMVPHSLIADEETTYERHNILVDTSRFASGVFEKIPRNVSVVNFQNNELVIGLFEKMDYYCTAVPEEEQKELLVHLTEEILYNVAFCHADTIQTDAAASNPVIAQALRYINENISTPLQVETICNALYITKSHLHHLFLKNLNTTPKKYITTLKLHLVHKELQSGRNPTEVCACYGFSSYTTFYRNYTQHFGVPPSQGQTVQNQHVIF